MNDQLTCPEVGNMFVAVSNMSGDVSHYLTIHGDLSMYRCLSAVYCERGLGQG